MHHMELETMAQRLKEAVDSYCEFKYAGEHREHLGASIIGDECARKIWNVFRWTKLQQFSGRMYRLFNDGHEFEPEIIELLKGIGSDVWSVDESGKQFRITGSGGHFGGSSDSITKLPLALFPELEAMPILAEFKTHNQRSFQHLLKNKVVLAKPEHYGQMCSYGEKFGFKLGLYIAKNKNDSDLYYEFVPLNPNHAIDLAKKADDIIRSQIPPPKISLQPEYFECKMCHFRGQCHENEPVEKNCRSCRYAEPIDNAEWFCHNFQQRIPHDFIQQGCEKHIGIV